MRKLLTFLIALGAIVFAIVSPVSANGVLILAQRAPSAPCSQATAFLARTSGLSGTETTAYTNMICGMVTDGVWAKLDVLYIFATNNTTTANLNLVSTSFTGTTLGSPTFTADQGYTAVVGAAINSGFQPSTSSGNYSRNSANVGVYDLTNRTTANSGNQLGANTGNGIQLIANSTGNATLYDVNDSAFPTTPVTSAQGLWLISRTGSTTMTLYENGASLASSSATSGTPTTDVLYFLARNNSGTIQGGSGDQIAAGWSGGGFTSTDAFNFSCRLNGFMTALSINVYTNVGCPP